jgi:AcrR family transcriptional regulator
VAPTGIAIRDVRQQLFDAAERILRRDGHSALTSRSVTDEAGVAKGVLHRHFDDFDAFLAEFVRDRIYWMDAQAAGLRALAGTGTVVGNLAEALTTVFGSSITVAIVPLVTFRDGLRARLRETWPTGIPILQEAATMVSYYLDGERDLGRVRTDADLDTLARTLVGAAHLLFADRTGDQPDNAAVEKMVATVIGGVVLTSS